MKPSLPSPKSLVEETFLQQIKLRQLPLPIREFKFLSDRKFLFDFCWEEKRIAVEIEGGTRSGGRHTRPAGYEADCRKYNLAAQAGWRVFRFTTQMVTTGEGISFLEQILSTEFP